MTTDRPESSQSVLRVVRGRPSDEELAALTALVAATETDAVTRRVQPPLRGRWNDPARAFQRSLHPGPGAWRAAAWPS